MNNKTIVGTILGLLIVLGLVYWSLSNYDKRNDLDKVDTTPVVNQAPTSLTVNHYYNNNSHTIEGTMTLPTPCHTLSHTANVAESSPEQVSIAFVTKASEGLCTQVLADKFFRVVFEASVDAVITATLDGQPLNLIFSEIKEGITK